MLRRLTSCLCSLQVILRPGRTNLSPETQTTWWVQTVCLCSLTTSEEGNSWPVTERDEEGRAVAAAALPKPWQGAQCSMKYELDTLTLFTVPEKEKKTEEEKKNTTGEESGGPEADLLFLSFIWFGAFKACKK